MKQAESDALQISNADCCQQFDEESMRGTVFSPEESNRDTEFGT